MGLREKVALTITVIIFIQILIVTCSLRSTNFDDSNKRNQKRDLDTARNPSATEDEYRTKIRNKPLSDKNLEAIRKTFNFPDVEYPTASPPRPPYYLQETNKVQRNQIQRGADYPTSTTTFYSTNDNKKKTNNSNKKYSLSAKYKAAKNSGTTTNPEFGTTPKPYCFWKIGAFPEVEYPLSARDTWESNYWKQMTNSGVKMEDNNNGPNSISQVDTHLKTIKKSKSKKNNKLNYLNTTPAPGQEQSNKSVIPLTPYTTLYFDTTPSYNNREVDKNKNINTVSEKPTKNIKDKKYLEEQALLSQTEKYNLKDDYANSTTCPSITITLPKEGVQTTGTQDSLLPVLSEKYISDAHLNKFNASTNNTTSSFTYIRTTTPPYLSSEDFMSISSPKIHNNDKMPYISCNNKIASIPVVRTTVISGNSDNKDSCFEDKVRNRNSSKTFNDNIHVSPLSSREDVNWLPTDEEEFTTDVIPDFDENMLSMIGVSTSTLSPMTFIDVDEAWAKSAVIDTYKSVAYPDELEECYIFVP